MEAGTPIPTPSTSTSSVGRGRPSGDGRRRSARLRGCDEQARGRRPARVRGAAGAVLPRLVRVSAGGVLGVAARRPLGFLITTLLLPTAPRPDPLRGSRFAPGAPGSAGRARRRRADRRRRPRRADPGRASLPGYVEFAAPLADWRALCRATPTVAVRRAVAGRSVLVGGGRRAVRPRDAVLRDRAWARPARPGAPPRPHARRPLLGWVVGTELAPTTTD